MKGSKPEVPLWERQIEIEAGSAVKDKKEERNKDLV